MLKAVSNALISLLYPQACSLCKQGVEDSADGSACRDCWKQTKIFSNRDILCAKCGIFLRESAHIVEAFCHLCDDHLYDSARAVGVYENALSASVIRLKHVPSVAQTTRKHLINCFDRSPFINTNLIVPVPLSKKRLLERGFNQAAVLARILSKTSNIPIDEHSLVRSVHTPMHRVAMDKKARELTVKNAFAVTRPKLVSGKNILLIDDVFTSGSTVSHCAKVLKKNGAASVNVLTLARAV
ncbi:MAG: ComF family protein [Pyrinomonadaceae bacterium]